MAALPISQRSRLRILAFAGVSVFSQAGVGGAGDIHEADLGKIFAAVTTVDPDGTPGNGNEFQAGVLADNGGPVQTIAINSTSVARDAGGDGARPQTDPQDLNHNGVTNEPLPVDARGADASLALMSTSGRSNSRTARPMS